MNSDANQATGGATPAEPSTGAGVPGGVNPSPPSRRKWLLLFLGIVVLLVVGHGDSAIPLADVGSEPHLVG